MDDDLHLAPAEDRSYLKPILIAVGVLAIIGFAVFWFNPHKVATAQVTNEQTYAAHTEYGSLTAKGSSKMPGGMRVIPDKPASGPGAGVEDNLYVVANVHIDNNLRLPIFISGVTAEVVNAQGESSTVRAVDAQDIPRLEALFPQLKPMLAHPIADGEQAAPHASAEGQVVLPFPTMTQDTWHSKKSATLTLELAHQDPITIPLP